MTKPNFILIMADDLGYGDLSCFGHERIHTPNIDALAARGMTFTDFHSNGAVCTPTRAALLTGRYQQRSGLEGVIYAGGPTRQTGLDPQRNHCLAASLRDAGYTTAAYGKWHLGYQPQFNPVHHGFDEFRGYVSGNVDYHSHVDNSGVHDWWWNLTECPESGYVTDLVNQHAARFIETHKDTPFFLYVSHEAPHWPYQGRGDRAERFVDGKPGVDFAPKGARADQEAAYKEMVEAMDEGVGWIVDKLRAYDLEQNTLILFCSDNGAVADIGSNGRLRGAKGSLFEGGHRVPAIATWPGRIEAGVETDQTVLSMDLLPSFLALAGQAPPASHALDGVDLCPLLLEQKPLPARHVYWRYKQAAAIRDGRWKLLRDAERVLLYDLETDPAEQHDLSDEEPGRAESLDNALRAWEEHVLTDAALTA